MRTPFVPPGFRHLEGDINSGFVITEPRGNEFTFISSDDVTANGTLDGITFNEQLGRRPFSGEKFGDREYHETIDKAVIESAKKYGGFYIARYQIALTDFIGFSIKGMEHRTDISWYDAVEYAKRMRLPESVESHLVYGAEYDTTLQWLIDRGHKTFEEICKDSKKWGNYSDNKYSKLRVEVNGSNEEYKAGNVYDIAGNLQEWTMEQCGEYSRVFRGGVYHDYGAYRPASYRFEIYPDHESFNIGCRSALIIR